MNKQIAVVTFLIAVAALTAAYEFNDPLFNQILANELVELESSAYPHHRSRRDEDAVTEKCRPFRKKKLCCAEETFDELHDKDRDFKRECFKQVVGSKDGPREFDPFRCDKVDKHRRDMTCVSQCVGQKKDVLDKDGNVKEAEFGEFVKETMAKESWFVSIQDKVVSTCLAEARNATANRDTSDTESCNPAGVKLMHCMFREIQLGCPTEQIKDQKACARARDKIKRHNEFLPPPPQFLNDE
ncbi:hypothetical protein TcasGA2_TC013160 [Tribolium castaneum]|uniref:Uncharacterized protein n=1 Tax=Tribolium castaneum TaxID=7070 RepID=D6WNE2_TRICA|nr:PREDICTED: uncharacterized protein LOC660933 [Tribolium castaneum]EFA03231.1 hypothetical protein TcasGA2_TC013160 [Tribolium castaneum]|eukprot:XP_015836161.1 PREDICTED: uncharacterized protein LOC660933 [Tribolium castaneum]